VLLFLVLGSGHFARDCSCRIRTEGDLPAD